MMLPPLSCHFIWPFYLICSSIKFHKIRSKCVGCIFALHGEYSMENCKWILLFGTFDTSKNCHNAISNNGTLLKTMLSTAITRKQPPVAATKEIISKNEYGYKLSHITYVRQQQLCLNKTKKKTKERKRTKSISFGFTHFMRGRALKIPISWHHSIWYAYVWNQEMDSTESIFLVCPFFSREHKKWNKLREILCKMKSLSWNEFYSTWRCVYFFLQRVFRMERAHNL